MHLIIYPSRLAPSSVLEMVLLPLMAVSSSVEFVEGVCERRSIVKSITRRYCSHVPTATKRMFKFVVPNGRTQCERDAPLQRSNVV